MTIIRRIETRGCGCDAPEPPATLVSIDDALGRMAQLARPVAATQTVPLLSALGRVLADPVRAACMTPPFDNTAMDGYAVDTADFVGEGPWTFPVVATVPAGAVVPAVVGKGSVARIFTGAPLPLGADAVIRQEDARHSGQGVTFETRPEGGSNIRRAGGDMRRGQIVVDAGTRLDPPEIAACAAAGAGSVQVRRALRVGVLVTGDELWTPGTTRAPAGIWDVNTAMLCAALGSSRIDLVHVERVADRRDLLERSLAALAGQADLIVTAGGVSVGEEDHVKPALGALGGDVHFSGVAVKPGKPVSYGCIGKSHWLGLPGNPLAAFVMWQVFGTALVQRLTGQCVRRATRRHVVTAEAIRRKSGRCEIRPVTIAGFDARGREVVRFEDATHSGRVGALPAADGLMFLPAEVDHLPAGALVEFQPFCDA